MLDYLTKTLSDLGFSIVTGLAGYLIGYRLSRNRKFESEKRIKSNRAALEFYNILLEARQGLKYEPNARWHMILTPKVLMEQEQSAMRFRLFLSGHIRSRFDADWKAYFTHNPHSGDRGYPEKHPEAWDEKENC